MNLESMLRKAEKFGEVEIFHQDMDSTIARYNQHFIETGISYHKSGYSIRLNKGGRVSQVYFNQETQFPRALKEAVRMAKFSKYIRGYHFPDSSRYQRVKTWSRDLANTDFNDLVEMVISGLDGIKEKGAEPMDGQAEVTESTAEIMNSNGVTISERSNVISFSMSAKKETGTGYDFWESGLLDFDPHEIGKNAGEEAVKNSRAKKTSWDGDVLLHPDMIDEFISICLSALDGDLVRKKSSPWVGKLGKRVLGSITIIEDPWIPYFPGSYSSDDEGIPTKKKPLILDGVLKTYIYDTITAKLTGAKPTGNGFRQSYSSGVGIDVSNIVVDYPEREGIDNLDNFILIRSLMGFHNINPKTGDFSLTLDNGIIHKGDNEIPTKGGLFVGNLYKMLENVKLATKKDYRRGDLITPYLLSTGRIVS